MRRNIPSFFFLYLWQPSNYWSLKENFPEHQVILKNIFYLIWGEWAQAFGKARGKIRAAAVVCFKSSLALNSLGASTLPGLCVEHLYGQRGDTGTETGRVANRVARHQNFKGKDRSTQHRCGRATCTQGEERHKAKTLLMAKSYNFSSVPWHLVWHSVWALTNPMFICAALLIGEGKD